MSHHEARDHQEFQPEQHAFRPPIEEVPPLAPPVLARHSVKPETSKPVITVGNEQRPVVIDMQRPVVSAPATEAASNERATIFTPDIIPLPDLKIDNAAGAAGTEIATINDPHAALNATLDRITESLVHHTNLFETDQEKAVFRSFAQNALMKAFEAANLDPWTGLAVDPNRPIGTVSEQSFNKIWNELTGHTDPEADKPYTAAEDPLQLEAGPEGESTTDQTELEIQEQPTAAPEPAEDEAPKPLPTAGVTKNELVQVLQGLTGVPRKDRKPEADEPDADKPETPEEEPEQPTGQEKPEEQEASEEPDAAAEQVREPLPPVVAPPEIMFTDHNDETPTPEEVPEVREQLKNTVTAAADKYAHFVESDAVDGDTSGVPPTKTLELVNRIGNNPVDITVNVTTGEVDIAITNNTTPEGEDPYATKANAQHNYHVETRDPEHPEGIVTRITEPTAYTGYQQPFLDSDRYRAENTVTTPVTPREMRDITQLIETAVPAQRNYGDVQMSVQEHLTGMAPEVGEAEAATAARHFTDTVAYYAAEQGLNPLEAGTQLVQKTYVTPGGETVRIEVGVEERVATGTRVPVVTVEERRRASDDEMSVALDTPVTAEGQLTGEVTTTLRFEPDAQGRLTGSARRTVRSPHRPQRRGLPGSSEEEVFEAGLAIASDVKKLLSSNIGVETGGAGTAAGPVA